MERGLVFDVKNLSRPNYGGYSKEYVPFRMVDLGELDGYYKELECDTIDIVTRSIGGVEFDIVVDDEGLLKDDPIVSAIWNDFSPALVGNLIFTHHDVQGNLTGITPADILAIIKSLVKVGSPSKTMMLIRLDE